MRKGNSFGRYPLLITKKFQNLEDSNVLVSTAAAIALGKQAAIACRTMATPGMRYFGGPSNFFFIKLLIRKNLIKAHVNYLLFG